MKYDSEAPAYISNTVWVQKNKLQTSLLYTSMQIVTGLVLKEEVSHS